LIVASKNEQLIEFDKAYRTYRLCKLLRFARSFLIAHSYLGKMTVS